MEGELFKVNKNKIFLNKFESCSLGGKFFLIKKGKIISRDVLETGKIITNENSLKEGEIVGNFFNFLPQNNLLIPEVDIEVEALEDNTILEEFHFCSKEFSKNIFLEKMILQLIKKSMIKFFYQLYDTKGYLLAILKLSANEQGIISKKEINYENFNISRSQFYLLYSNLKKENYIKEKEKNVHLNLNKINKYLEKSYN